jgi:hypothetical protein
MIELQIQLIEYLFQQIVLRSDSVDPYTEHMEIGIWPRNRWGLWKDYRLTIYFNSFGVTNADDMSGIIDANKIWLRNETPSIKKLTKKLE